MMRKTARLLPALCLIGNLAGAQTTAPTARQIVEQIQQHLGVSLAPNTVDTFKAGNPDTPVTGIAVTMMATFDVLQRAAARGDNFVITHEPTFYNHLDKTADLEKQGDAVLAEKQSFISQHHLVVWRFHDGWHARRPDGILLGMTKALGWEKFENKDQPSEFSIPETNLNALALDVERKLQNKVLRVVGKPDLAVKQVAFLPGAAGSARQ
ncbi:MAG TPA: Nif3-like dinuclear metal center hexameric protein, partial [Bryobacteraceae bacterium]|nr:Nif3-like dinuclear metal center hexameric protein [Bryobacteraceae bacterium]